MPRAFFPGIHIIRAIVRIGPYEVLGRIAVGGMAEVLLGWSKDIEGDGLVAIKVMLPQFASDQEFQEMFLDEARLAALIHHPNVVKVYDLGMEDNRLYLVTEYVRGLSTSMLVKRVVEAEERIHPRLVAAMIIQAAAGLNAAHQTRDLEGRFLGLVHRDVSPQNLLLSLEGDIKVTDFGVAKAANRLSETMTNVVKGKVGYMSPEQARGDRVDRRSDIFSLGLVSYELLTGDRALFGDTENELAAALAALAAGTFEIDLNRPEIPPRFKKIIARAIEISPDKRYATAAEMQAELLQMLPGGLEQNKVELRRVSERYSAKLPASRSEAKKLLEPVYELSFDGNIDTMRRPVRRITRERLLFYAVSIAGFSLLGGMLIGSAMMTRKAAVFYRRALGIGSLLGSYAAPPEEMAPGEGELRVESSPNGEVEVDGRDYGLTPMVIRVESGRRVLVVRIRDQNLEAREFVEVKPGDITRKHFEAADGKFGDTEELRRRRKMGESP
jgi:eukaryotic-like serine/threonine-protein kinase